MILKTNAFSVVSSSFAIYLKVYWNGTTVFLFIVLRVCLTILAVTWLFFQVFSKISLINRRYNDKESQELQTQFDSSLNSTLNY